MVSKVLFLPATALLPLLVGLSFSTDALAIANPTPAQPTPSLLNGQISGQQGQLVAQLSFTFRGVTSSRNRQAGISRGGSACSPDGNSFTAVALLPKNQTNDPYNRQIDVQPIVDDHPTLFVYIPETIAQTAQFTLSKEISESKGTSDENLQPIYQTTFALPGQPGVVAVTLPKDVTPLQIDSFYHWSLSLQCDPTDNSGNPVVEGWLQRVDLSPAQVSLRDRTTPRNLPAFYARAGMWQDTLATLAKLRISNPNDQTLTQDWVSLLNSADLGNNIANAPLININVNQDGTATLCDCNSNTRP
jgi:hypothetical protein